MRVDYFDVYEEWFKIVSEAIFDKAPKTVYNFILNQRKLALVIHIVDG